jgi:hypothetical protein
MGRTADFRDISPPASCEATRGRDFGYPLPAFGNGGSVVLGQHRHAPGPVCPSRLDCRPLSQPECQADPAARCLRKRLEAGEIPRSVHVADTPTRVDRARIVNASWRGGLRPSSRAAARPTREALPVRGVRSGEIGRPKERDPSGNPGLRYHPGRMTAGNKLGFGFAVVGLMAGLTLGILGIDITPPMYMAVAVVVFVTVFWFRYRERTK